MDDHKFERTRGLEWGTTLYIKLIGYCVDINISLEVEIVKNITLKNNMLRSLSKHIYPKYGHFKKHKESVLFFLLSFLQNVIEDYASK